MLQGLPPAVQHSEKAGLRAQMFRISGDGQQSRGHGTKEQIVNDRLVLIRDGSNGRREREDYMEILDRQEFAAAVGEPLIASLSLTLGAMSVTIFRRCSDLPMPSA